MPGYGRVTPPARGERISWVDSATERASAGRALGIPFFATVVAVALAGVLTIAFTPVDDVKFAGLDERLEEAGHNITCLRAARRAAHRATAVRRAQRRAGAAAALAARRHPIHR